MAATRLTGAQHVSEHVPSQHRVQYSEAWTPLACRVQNIVESIRGTQTIFYSFLTSRDVWRGGHTASIPTADSGIQNTRATHGSSPPEPAPPRFPRSPGSPRADAHARRPRLGSGRTGEPGLQRCVQRFRDSQSSRQLQRVSKYKRRAVFISLFHKTLAKAAETNASLKVNDCGSHTWQHSHSHLQNPRASGSCG